MTPSSGKTVAACRSQTHCFYPQNYVILTVTIDILHSSHLFFMTAEAEGTIVSPLKVLFLSSTIQEEALYGGF